MTGDWSNRGRPFEFRFELRALCAITDTNEVSVLYAAHIIPHSEEFADGDKPEIGLLLQSDVHKLFDVHLISIEPT